MMMIDDDDDVYQSKFANLVSTYIDSCWTWKFT